MKNSVISILLGSCLSLSWVTAWGFAFNTYDGTTLVASASGVPVTWQQQRIAVGIAINQAPYQQDVLDAMADWNATGANIELVQGQTSSSPCIRDRLNSIGFTQNTCSGDWGDALGLTVIQWVSSQDENYIVEADIMLRSFSSEPTDSWAQPGDPLIPDDRSCYANRQSGGITCDFKRVVLHELGHAIGLTHPDAVGQSVAAVMNSGSSRSPMPRALAADDIAGSQAIYGNDRNAIDGTAGLALTSGGALKQSSRSGGGALGLDLVGLMLLFIYVKLHIKRLRKEN